jgi:hypothetical protein
VQIAAQGPTAKPVVIVKVLPLFPLEFELAVDSATRFISEGEATLVARTRKVSRLLRAARQLRERQSTNQSSRTPSYHVARGSWLTEHQVIAPF